MNANFFVDAHCHVDLYERPSEIIAAAERARVYTIAVTNAPFVFKHTAELVANCRYVRAAAGLHPELVATHGQQAEMLRPLLKETRYVGEIGLDYTTNDENVRRRQREVFDKILGWCAEEKNKILTIHSRRAASDTISAIGHNFPGKAILHWFSGNAKELQRAAENGLYFSVNQAMITSEKGRSLILQIPINRILTETDGPFVKISRQQPAHPASVERTVRELASLWQIPSNEVQTQIMKNFRALLTKQIL